MLVPAPGEAAGRAAGRADPGPPQLLGRSSGRQDAQVPHSQELLQEFRELFTHFASVCAAGSSLLFRTLLLSKAGLAACQGLTLLWKDPQSGALSSSPAVRRTAQVLPPISTHFSARWIFHWISHNLFNFSHFSPHNMGQTLCWAVVPLWE